MTREVVEQVQVPHEVVQRVESVKHVVQPIQVIEEPVVQQVVSVNRKVVGGAPYVANTTQNVLPNPVTAAAPVAVAPMAAPGMAIAGSQASALAMDAADGRTDGKYFGARPVAPADWATLQADPLRLWGPPEASWAAAVSALPADPLALTQPRGFPGGRGVEEVLTSPPLPR